MKWLWTSLAVAVFSTVAMAQQIKLSGRVITDTGEPVPNTKVQVLTESAHTDANGRFSIQLSSKLREGQRVTIVVEKKNWVINQPLDGELNLRANDLETLDVIIASWGSKALWTPARIEKELKQKPDAIDLSEYIRQVAQKYGSTQQVTNEAFDKWATAQIDSGNRLRDQGRSIDGPEAVRLLGEAASAYRRALLVFTRDSMPLEWATSQHNLGFALQEQGARAKGPDAFRLLGEAVAAYRQALIVRTREQLPRQWATTQNDLGNALQGQGTRAEGTEAIRLLSEAADAYGQAMLFFTREYAPQEWAMTQHNLGSALHERGARTEGTEALGLFGEAVSAYRQALLVRTREQVPGLWALTQNNLGNALQAQATRAKDADATRQLDEAVTAYRQALLVFTREQRPQMWAMTKHNLGSALQEQGSRSQGPDANRLFTEAVTAYQEALLVWTREQRPQQWAMAQNNLVRAYFNSGSFEESERRILSVLSDVRVDARIKAPLLSIEIANLIALKRSTEVPSKMKDLIDLLESQPANFKLQWSFEGTKHFIRQSQQFGANKDWILRLLGAMAGENRDAIVKEVKILNPQITQIP